ncbi:MAG: hypothetical protein ACI924_001064 [Flavobacterium sp.]|jgi:hypothetical protein
MRTILHPTYFPSISHYIAMIQADEIVFEVDDNFQKQTNRNRMYIYGANGLHLLNISVKHSIEKNQKYKDVIIDKTSEWQKNHLKSLEAAYKNSPFFEYFIDDILPIYQKKHKFLIDLNFETFEIVNSCLGIDLPFSKTIEYLHTLENENDLRYLVNGKKDTTQLESYTQVFNDKHGFINNLSILDLLFNEGRYAVDYLKKQTL